jgi:chromosomal replication initiator protein
MGNAPDVAAAELPGDEATAARVLTAFRSRIGDDRFAVWFGGAARVAVAAGRRSAGRRGGVSLLVRVGSGFTHEWLRRTFHVEFLAAAREVCGPNAAVAWEPVSDDAAATDGAPAAAQPPRPGRSRAAVRPAGPKSPVSAASRAPEPRRREPSRELSVVAKPGPAVTMARRSMLRLADFVVGPSNRMACGAVELATMRPGDVSPLVIHGPSGVGKTHLLEGTCERARERHPGINAVCLSAEQFTTGFLQALHASGLPGFRRTCRTADLLVIDDLQFFVGKKATLLELLHTLDAVQRQGRQVVFACDRELDSLPDLGPDLLTRLRGGMIARMLSPDYEVRRGIVASVCAKRDFAIPEDVIHFIATNMTRHARELFGAVNRLEATSLMLGMPVTLGMAEEALSDLVRSSARSVRLADIERAVCKAFGIESGSLQSSRRARTASHPRMLAMFLARKHTQAALAEIGTYFGRRSHSTVIAAQKAVGDWVQKRSPIMLADSAWDVEEAIRRVEDVLRAG